MANKPSSIDRLPPEVRELIGRLRERDGRTIDEIMDKLRELDVEVSRSALGRHVKGLNEVGERMRRSRDMALALVDRFGDQPDNKLGRVNLELMHGVVMQTLVAAGDDGEGVSFSPQDAKFLAGALASLATAQKTDADRYLRAKAELAKEAAGKLDQAAAAGEIDPDAVLRARRILGFET